MRSNLFYTSLLGLGLLGTACSHAPSSSPKPTATRGPSLVLLYVSDLHSSLRPSSEGLGGYAELASWIEAEKKAAGSQTDVFVLGGGDLWGRGALPCQSTQDKACVPLLSQVPVQFGTLGNYELYESPANLNQMIAASGVQYLGSNVSLQKNAASTPWLKEAHRLQGAKSGLGVWLSSWTGPADITKHYQIKRFPSPSDWAQLKQKTQGEPVVFLTQMELAQDHSFLKEACVALRESNQVVALLKGQDHKALQKDLTQCAPILQPGAYGHHAVKLVLTPVAGQKAYAVTSEFVTIKGFEPKADIKQAIDKIYATHAPQADEVLFNLASDVSREDLAQWVAEAYRVRTRADAAILNIGYVKYGLTAGPVRQEDFLKALPYENELKGRDWSVKNLEKLLCDRSRMPRDEDLDWGSDLVISGFELQNAGTPQCKIVGSRKSSLKVVVDSYLVSRSARWLSGDISQQVFRFGVDSRRVSFLHLKDNPPKSR